MTERFGLRLRIGLFFAFLAAGGAVLAALALWLGFQRAAGAGAASGFVMAGLLLVFGWAGLCVGVWLLFDENLARPIERLAAGLRSRAHAGATGEMDLHTARHLGDLAPAAAAISARAAEVAAARADAVAEQTAQLAAEKDLLTALLSEIPVATILLSDARRIVLYDGQAAEVLAQIGPPRLDAPIADYLEEADLAAAHDRMRREAREVRFTARGVAGRLAFQARLRPLGGAPGAVLLIDAAEARIAPGAARPLVYDFALLERATGGTLDAASLEALRLVVFDTETTGLLPHRDEIVQIGALRVVGGRIVPGERLEMLVDPGRPIPRAATRVHGITDAMVAGAPDIGAAARQLHDFARGAVIVAHNAPFDMAFLHRQAGRDGLVWDHPVLDTVLLSAVLFGASETHTLDALCARLGVEIPAPLRHTAPGDALATAEALCRMLPMLRARGLTTLGEVIAQTRRHRRLLEDLN
ncbi:DNA polymerase-3 subunit epsilon [Salinihabitans flavidus]|uniref:DNA-directed DNA polymerase n=1 Tax=Salinihabitans flavidus TaxID=569882 RepID=A0A1H8PIZ7_9RHOB|nr:3'-5' exonuclease [Salinihabitans flavidus]SEO41677.1 DNA polymerase-3 subunit epsilon [Salinihabitans flavidus]